MKTERLPGNAPHAGIQNREWTAPSYDIATGRSHSSINEAGESGNHAKARRQLADTDVKHTVVHGKTHR